MFCSFNPKSIKTSIFLGLHQPLTRSFILRSIMGSFLHCGALIGRHSLYLAIGQKNKEKQSSDNSLQGSFWASDFFNDSPNSNTFPLTEMDHILQVDRQEFVRELRGYGQDRGWSVDTPLVWQEGQKPHKADFCSDFSRIQKGISEGEIAKAVPVTWETFSYFFNEEGIWRHLLRLLQNAHENLIPYGYWSAGEKGMLGATPEVLFESSDGCRFQTMALAGTLFDEEICDIVFLQDPKELSEHRHVVSFIKDKLEGWADRVSLGETTVLPLTGLRHLCTPIEFAFAEQKVDPVFLLDQFHPTPALGVSSEKKDWHWLKQLSGQKERREFGAPFGFHTREGSSLFVVSIRNIMWQGSQGRIGAGCGIVSESQLEKEWSELAAKRHSVKKLFGAL